MTDGSRHFSTPQPEMKSRRGFDANTSRAVNGGWAEISRKKIVSRVGHVRTKNWVKRLLVAEAAGPPPCTWEVACIAGSCRCCSTYVGKANGWVGTTTANNMASRNTVVRWGPT